MAWTVAGSPNASNSFAVPLISFQSEVLRTLAAQRSPDSYIAGDVAINRQGPRYSGDIDIFQDNDARLESAAHSDTEALIAAGYSVRLGREREGKRDATVMRGGDEMPLEWVTDSAFRFFPTQPDELFGYVLHPADLAANKASAAADRREPRDIVDLLTIHGTILPLGAVVCAAVGKFPGVTPEEMLAEIRQHSRFTAEEFQVLATEKPIDATSLRRQIRNLIAEAESFIARLPIDAVGVLFMDNEIPVQPDVSALEKYQRNPGAPRGFWPSSPGISRARCSSGMEIPNFNL